MEKHYMKNIEKIISNAYAMMLLWSEAGSVDMQLVASEITFVCR